MDKLRLWEMLSKAKLWQHRKNCSKLQSMSYGTTAPYAFPDLDDTAVALLGMAAP